MINLTRLNNTAVTLNSDLIKYVEQSPDTVITLLNGEKILVRESCEQVVDRIVCFRRRLLADNSTWHLAPPGLQPANQSPDEENGPRG